MAGANVETLAKALNLTPRRVQQLAGDGMPKAERGVYDIGVCMAWYIRYLQKAIEKRQDPDREGDAAKFTRQRSRLAQEQADRFGLENARRRGELCLVAYVETLFQGMTADITARLDAIGGRLANEFPGNEPATVRAKVRAETDAVRTGVAEYFAKLRESDASVAAPEVETAAPEERVPVGRRKPNPAGRKRRARKVSK